MSNIQQNIEPEDGLSRKIRDATLIGKILELLRISLLLIDHVKTRWAYIASKGAKKNLTIIYDECSICLLYEMYSGQI
jgi:hypothetical protein